MVLFADLVFYMPLYFKMLPFTYLIHIHYKKLHTTRTGRHSARFRPSAGLFSPFRPECTAEAQDTGWLCFCRRGALLRWRESALFFKSPLSERQQAASSDFLKTLLADFRRPRSQPPTKPQTSQHPLPRRPFIRSSPPHPIHIQKKTPRHKKRSAFTYSRYCEKIIKQKPDQPSQPQQSPASS